MGGAIGGAVNNIGSLDTFGQDTNIMGDLTGQTAAQQAANAQTQAADSAIAMQTNMYNQQQANAAPYIQSGQQNLATLNADMANGSLTNQMTMQQFQQSPGYQFQLQQGQQAVQRSAASKGLLNSVGTQQNLDSYSQGLANQDYQQALTNFTNNQQQRYNMLSSMANMGQTANNQMGGAAQVYGNQYGANMSGIGNAQSAADMQGYNGMMGLAKTGTSALGSMGSMAAMA